MCFAQLPIHLEAEAAQLDGPSASTSRPGFSGSGYATDVTKKDARKVWTVRAKPGIYVVRVRYATPSGPKEFEISANGTGSKAMFADTHGSWSTLDAGRIELREGTNELTIERGRGYFDVDYLELTPAVAPRPPKRVPGRRVDRKATAETQSLYARLLKGYGSTTWSGQYENLSVSSFVRRLARPPHFRAST